MSKCKLGPKKIKRLEAITGRKIIQALVRGGWPHGYALVEFEDNPQPWPDDYDPGLINYKTGEPLPNVDPFESFAGIAKEVFDRRAGDDKNDDQQTEREGE